MVDLRIHLPYEERVVQIMLSVNPPLVEGVVEEEIAQIGDAIY